jgi:hypothetical protein
MQGHRWIKLLVVALAITLGAPAHAQDEARFRQALDAFTSYVSAQLGSNVRMTTGQIQIRAEGGAQIATIPNVTFAGVSDRGRLEVGTVTVTRRETAPGRGRYEAQLPRAMRAFDETGETAAITLGENQIAVVIEDANLRIHDASLAIAQVQIRGLKDRGQFDIAQVAVSSRVEARPDGLLDNPAVIRIAGVRFQDPQNGQEVFRMGAVGFRWLARGFSWEAWDRMRAAVEEAQKAPEREQPRRMLDSILGLGVQGFGTGVELSELVTNDRTQQTRIGSFTYTDQWEAMNDQASRYNARIGVQGLTLPRNTPYQQLVAGRTELQFVLDKIPTQAVLQFMREGMELGPGGNPPAMRRGAGEALMAAALQAGSTLRIAPFMWDAPALGVHLNGQVTGNQGGAIPVVASGELAIRGLETLAQQLGLGQGQEAGMIAMLQGLGQQGAGPDGQPSRLYRFEVSPDGRATLNGTDMSAIMGMAQQPQRQQPQRQAPQQQQRQPAPAK